MYKKLLTLILATVCAGHIFSQDIDLFKMLEEESNKESKREPIILLQHLNQHASSTGILETLGKKILDLEYRIGSINSVMDFTKCLALIM